MARAYTTPGHPDHEAGVVFYTQDVHRCPCCKRQTNCAYRTSDGGTAIACSSEKADHAKRLSLLGY